MMVWTQQATLQAALIEQVMRATNEDVLLLPFLDIEPGSKAAHTALGRLLSGCAVRLVVGCPLMAFVAGAALDPNWRAACPPTDEPSLWKELEFLTTLYGPVSAETPYAALEELRNQAEAELVS